MDTRFFMSAVVHALYHDNMPFSTKLLTLQGNCKHKQCFICHALSYSSQIETKNMSGCERVNRTITIEDNIVVAKRCAFEEIFDLIMTI